jgi:hypothetical protein
MAGRGVMGQAKRGELERAARQLGVTSTTLRQHGRRDRVCTAAGREVQVRVVRDRDIKPGEVGSRLAARPGWLIAEQERRQAQTAREAANKLRRELAEVLVTLVHEVWFQELKHAVTGADIDARWTPEVGQAKQEARRLAGELSVGQVRARTAGNGTPLLRRPVTGSAGSCGGRWRGDGGQVRDP